MLKETIEQQCGRICPSRGRGADCLFAPSEDTGGFIDMSSARDGSRGIAFCFDRMYLNTDGFTREIPYGDISAVNIIDSYEDAFADELSIVRKNGELRISDYSLNKGELKTLIDTLCREQRQHSDKRKARIEQFAAAVAQKLTDETAANTARKMESVINEEYWKKHDPIPVEGGEPVIEEAKSEIKPSEKPAEEKAEEKVSELQSERVTVPEDHVPAVIPEEGISWISGSKRMKPLTELKKDPEKPKEPELPPVMNGLMVREPVIYEHKPPEPIKKSETKKTEEIKKPEKSEKEKAEKPKVIEKPEEKKPEPPKPTVPERSKAPEKPAELSENEMREKIERMGDDEMMKFLMATLSEINDDKPFFEETSTPGFFVTPEIAEAHKASESPAIPETREAREALGAPEVPEIPEVPEMPEIPEVPEEKSENGQDKSDKSDKSDKLTVEPVWGDIYIKASRSLRELCESGRITMEQMEQELRSQLLSAARAFEEIVRDEAKVPKVFMPKITELKAAVADFDRYFGYGEDIAVRAMFFMLYQMLTYADRITESPETKDRLNDFFRRFGSAVITLSMLDTRI